MQVFFGCHDDNSIDEDHEKDGQSGKFTDQSCVGQRPVLVVRKGGMLLLPLFRAVLSLIHSMRQATRR